MDSVIIHRRNIFLLRLFCVLMLFMLTTAGVDYYAILGVSKNADNRDLAKAYRNLAVKWHPDKHSENKGLAAEKFMEIRESYDFLKDPLKRQFYDTFGTDWGFERETPNESGMQTHNKRKKNQGPEQSR